MGKFHHLLSSIQGEGCGEGRGRLRHLLWLIKRGRWRSEGWVCFGICYRRSKGGGEGEVKGKLYHPLTSASGGEGMGKLHHLLLSIKRGGGGVLAGYG